MKAQKIREFERNLPLKLNFLIIYLKHFRPIRTRLSIQISFKGLRGLGKGLF